MTRDRLTLGDSEALHKRFPTLKFKTFAEISAAPPPPMHRADLDLCRHCEALAAREADQQETAS